LLCITPNFGLGKTTFDLSKAKHIQPKIQPKYYQLLSNSARHIFLSPMFMPATKVAAA